MSGRHRLQHLEVEHGVVERDRDELLGLEADRAREIGIGHGREVDGADDHPRSGDADPDLALLQAELAPQALDRGGDRAGVEDLALAHRVEGQCDLAERAEGDGVVELDVGDAHGVGADVEADDTTGGHD